MGAKGDRAVKEPLAMRLYADGMGLAAIARQIDISETSLRTWKAESAVPGEEIDGWDKARAQKRGNIQRLRDLFERQLEYVEKLRPEEVTAPMMDTVTKLGALVQRYEAADKGGTYDKARVFLENLQWIAAWLREHDPEGLKVLAESFDAMTEAFKTEQLNA